jgi:type VI secretion system secreted protein VgrG
MGRLIEIATPLVKNMLMAHRMQVREALSSLGDIDVDLLSERADIEVDGVLGQNMTVKLELQDGSPRYFNGYVSRFAQTGTSGRYHAYRATLRPWLWFLTRTADCRIFQDMTAPEIIAQVFSAHHIADFRNCLTDSYRRRDYCVQYRETDFNFVSRLMEEEGIYYYFLHGQEQHTLVLADGYSAHQPAPNYETIPFVGTERMVRPEQETISSWEYEREVRPGKYQLQDYDFERPSAALRVGSTAINEHALAEYEIYDYPGDYGKSSDGEQYVRRRMEEQHARFETAHGESNARGLAAGFLFRLSSQSRSDQNREYLITSTTYTIASNAYETQDAGEAACVCSFTAQSSREQFRPPRHTPRPVIQGPQTAIVVGPRGDEIHTDKYGRVKVQFHWDRYGKRDENSSCWIRTAHPWAGKGWGMIAIPRIGQEVIVEFLEGNPDRPIITGRVYNAEQMPPYTLPANMTQSGILSRSTRGGTSGNANEFRFEDKKGDEQVLLHAEKDLKVETEHDETRTVGHDRNETIGRNDSLDVGKELMINAGDSVTIVTGSASLTMKRDGTIRIEGKDINIEASNGVTIRAGGQIVINGSKVNIN